MRALPVLVLALAGAAAAAPVMWHQTRDEGVAAAAKSRKPVLVVTLWKDGV